MEIKLSRSAYLEALERLGSGITFVDSDGDLAIQPLPRYRQRTSDGRHVA